MHKLTENIIMQRVRSSSTDFDKISQLNITGRGLSDISLLKKLIRLQVLSLSVNNISSLADLESCKHLKALHMRQNKIKDLDEIRYLMNLPVLESLSLSENPCTEDPNYRLTVIKNLRHLLELDGVPVTAEERKKAMALGRDITPNINLLKNLGNYIPDGPQIERSPTSSVLKLNETVFDLIESETPSELVLEEEQPKLSISNKEIKQITIPQQNDCEKIAEVSSVGSLQKMEEKPRNLSEEDFGLKPFYCKVCKSKSSEPAPFFRMQTPAPNLLSATLFLINELDYSSLQTVHSHVSTLLNAFRLNCHLSPKFQNSLSKY